MSLPFKVSPKVALAGAALATEVRHTYPLSARDEHELRAAVQNILVKRLSRPSVSAEVVRDFDVRQAARALGVKTADLRRKLASQGLDTARGGRRSRALSKKSARPKTKRVTSHRSKARSTSRSLAGVRG